MNKPQPPSNKILLALQFWDGDRSQAFRLAKLLSDMEPEHCKLADFLLVARFDCKHSDQVIKDVSRKFNTFSYISKGRGTGWPAGCNDLFFGTMGWFYHKKLAGQIPNYKAIFTFEADGVPMQKDWVKKLSESWDTVNQKSPVCMAGAWLDNGPDGIGTGHINGNAIMSGDFTFLKWLITHASNINVRVGWDWILAPQFKARGWADIPQIRSVWRTELTEEMFLGGMREGRIWHHGVKDDAGIQFCRKYLI